jgi:hypothetical protein
MKRELDGWQRLWLATAVVYLICVLLTGYLIMPDSNQLGRELVTRAIDEVRKFNPFAFIGEAPQVTYAAARKEGYAAWERRLRAKATQGVPAPGFDRIEKEYRQALAELPARQLKVGCLLALGWLGPMALLTLVNRTVRWIIRGPGKSSAPGDN